MNECVSMCTDVKIRGALHLLHMYICIYMYICVYICIYMYIYLYIARVADAHLLQAVVVIGSREVAADRICKHVVLFELPESIKEIERKLLCQNTSAYVSIYVIIRQHTSAYL